MVSIQESPEEKLIDFLKSFKDENGDYKYRKKLSLMALTGQRSLVVDFDDLIVFDPELSRRVVSDPDDFFEPLQKAALTQLAMEDPEYAEQVKKVFVRFRRIPEKLSLRRVGAEHLNRLVLIDGIVVRSTPVKPTIVKAAFQCRSCNETILVEQKGQLMRGVSVCPSCKGRLLDLDIKNSIFMNSQELRIQERPEDLPPGQLPRAIDVISVEDLVDVARPGDRVSVTGVLRALQEISGKGAKLRTFELLLEANYIDIPSREAEVLEITPEEEDQIKLLAKDPWINRKLIQSLAPSIYGYQHIKEAILYLLFGGVRKTLPDGVTIRGDINVLLVGDPGTAKSALLQYTSRIAPRGLYTSGRGSTAAGLTAAVLREKTGGMVLEAGALVLADKGVASIDEIDKMRPEDRVAIHEAMEQQSYHPSFEVMLADGEKLKIGRLVDGLFQEYAQKKIVGIDCEILPIRELNLKLITTRDLKRFETVNVDRVSRHTAPDSFIQISYSNGREVLVTPDHPVFVYREGGLSTIPAYQIKEGDFSPGPKCLTFTPSQTISVAPSIRRSGGKSVTLTPSMADEMANMSRYPIAEAAPPFYSQDFGGPLGDILFGAPPYAVNTPHNKSHGPLLTYKLAKARSAKTPERTSAERVPGRINRAPSSIVKNFLRSVFSKNGAMESNAVSLIARSRGLAEDYQDLLLRMGITSRIVRLGTGDFKVFIPRDSLKPFIKCIIGTGKYRLYPYPRSRSKAASDTDLLPADIGFKAVTLLRNLGLRETRVYAGLSGDSVSKGYVSKLIKAADQRLIELSRGLLEKTDIRSIRRLLRWSRREAARRIGLSIEAIDNAERSRYSPGQSQVILEKLRRAASDLVQQASLEVRRLKDLSQGSIRWLRVEKVRRLPNKGPLRTRWVYDLTVEPTHNFVSHGLILHNTVSVAKGGIVATLNARASILAAANPALGRYDPYRLIADNINLPVTILSRFDLIFLMKDLPDPERDAKTSDHILELHKVKRAPDEPPLSPELLRKYIAYGRRLETALTDETVRKLKEFYLKMRSLSTTSPGSPIAITPRQLEALVRLSEARAKTFLRDKVLPEDANAVITLMTLSLQDVGMDTSTGKIDIDVIMTGKSKSLRDMMQLIRSTLADLEEDGGAVEEPKLYDELRKIGLKDEDIKKGLTQLIKEGLIYSPRTGYLKRTTG